MKNADLTLLLNFEISITKYLTILLQSGNHFFHFSYPNWIWRGNQCSQRCSRSLTQALKRLVQRAAALAVEDMVLAFHLLPLVSADTSA